ncbi:uncharacterized protein [Pyxicephalus adspersus]|uniref:uncharacterized protein n=1 Tax=Pyxicephalus adspersus TaxID=30357 RepID=UPI003B5CD29C
MKIAVIFLLVSIVSFIDPSSGILPKLNTLDKGKADHYIRNMQAIGEKLVILKNCPEEERKAREKCLVEDLIHHLKMSAIDLGCSLGELFEILGLPLGLLELIELNNITEILKLIGLDKLLYSVTQLVEAFLAPLNIILKEQILFLSKTLDTTLDLGLFKFLLHDTLNEITSSISGTILGSVFGNLNVPLKIVGSLLGNLS